MDAYAGNVVGLKSFTAGTPALASEVNGNFNAVKSAVDDNNARLAVVESSLQTAGAVSLSAFTFSDLYTGVLTVCHFKRNDYVFFDAVLDEEGSCSVVAPVSLPQSVTLTSVSCLVYHDAIEITTPNISQVALQRMSLSTGDLVTVFNTYMTSTATGMQNLSSIFPGIDVVVDNNDYAYYIDVDFDLFGLLSPTDLRLYGCKVTYHP
ncbi:MAG: hypothetical protein V4440_05145 [Pseudomonadota bacterium]